MKRLLVYASGTKTGGGSGFLWLIHGLRCILLDTEIVGVVSNHPDGGVKRIADQFGIPFVYLENPTPTAADYLAIQERFKPDLTVFSGWMKFVLGITGVNIHPGILPETGGLAGHKVHEKAIELFKAGTIPYTMVTMHVIPVETVLDKSRYDTGIILFQFPVAIMPDDTSESLGSRVNEVEHARQAEVTNWIINRKICWTRAGQVIAPFGYPYLRRP